MGVIFGILLARKGTTRSGGAVEVRAASLGRRGFDDRGIWMDRHASVALEHQRTGIAR
jgi:asparagine synthetase B (glutamine-hydrolysing)